MLAEKIDIGSMGDYPMLINGSKTQANPLARTEMVSVTGYNPKGALNMVVVSPDSPATALADLAGTKVSASVGSAGHGTLVRALDRAGVNPRTGVEVLNQQPQVGASALESGQVQALSQFVAWPGLLVYQGKAKLLYDGAELNLPTLHGVVVRRSYAAAHPEVLAAFLQAQLDATDFLNEKPLEAARIVAQASGLPQEVVYLYNGPGGTSFDPTLKPSLVDALKSDVPYLKSIGDFADLDVGGFVQDEPLRAVFGGPRPELRRGPGRHRQPVSARRRPRAGERALAGRIRCDSNACRPDQPAAGGQGCDRPRRQGPGGLCSRRASWAPDGSPTRRSGCRTARTTARSAPRPGPSRYLAAHPGSVASELPTGTGRFGMTAQVIRPGLGRSRRPTPRHAATSVASPWRSRLLRLASVAAAIGLWQLLTADKVRLWLRFDTLPTVTEIVHALQPPARHLRSTGLTWRSH